MKRLRDHLIARRESPDFCDPVRLEPLGEFDAELLGLDRIDAVVSAAKCRGACGVSAQLSAFVERVLDVELQRPLAPCRAKGKIGRGERRGRTDQPVFGVGQERPRRTLMQRGALDIGIGSGQPETVACRRGALEMRLNGQRRAGRRCGRFPCNASAVAGRIDLAEIGRQLRIDIRSRARYVEMVPDPPVKV